MGHAKHHAFPEDLQIISVYAKVLTHEARILIIKDLLQHSETTISHLNSILPLSRVSISQHMSFLKNIGLVSYREEHPNIYYFLNRNRLNSILFTVQNISLQLIKMS